MARMDKIEPRAGSFRAPLAANWAANMAGKIVGVGLNGSGRLVAGAGATGVIAVLCLTEAKNAGDMVDAMREGDIVDFETLADGTTPVTAGAHYYAAAADGVVSTTNTGTKIGFTVADDGTLGFRGRLVVAVAQ